ncbi:MAG: protoporphyrinogen oxidase [Candidatus Eremiobacteraeota bacterium]|nr:protoporphyrinogen oxidase [Candidatus Eremiobacteraeota bacterium]
MVDVAIVGAGVSGLACALRLSERGLSVRVFEAAAQAGGCVRTIRRGAYIADVGPQTFAMSQPLRELVQSLGLAERLIEVDRSDARAYLFHHGQLVAAPGSPAGLVSSPLLSVSAKLRLGREPFVPARKAEADESIAAFVERRAGRDIVTTFVDPIVSGIFAGDPATLSVQSVFPALVAMEKSHGSVLRGAAAMLGPSSRRPKGGAVAGFRGGNDALALGLLSRLSGQVRLDSPVAALDRSGEAYALSVGGKAPQSVIARRVVLACPAPVSADLLQPLSPQVAAELRAIDYPPVVQVALAYPRAAIGVRMDGFGFLVSRRAGLRILGAVWNSALYDDRVPPAEALVTAVLGGVTDRQVNDEDDDALARSAHDDLTRAMRIGGALPRVVTVYRWPAAIPQYALGHQARLDRIAAGLALLPDVTLCSNYLRGASVPECIRQATALAAGL